MTTTESAYERQVRRTYEKRREPILNCPSCHGTGEVSSKVFQGERKACKCTYLPSDGSDVVRQIEKLNKLIEDEIYRYGLGK